MSLAFTRFDTRGYLAQKSSVPAQEAPSFAMLVEGEREQFEERAAMMEFDGGIQRAKAEELALTEILAQRQRKATPCPKD